MNQNCIKTIGILDEIRKDLYFEYVNKVDGLIGLIGILMIGRIWIVDKLFQFRNLFFLELCRFTEV